MGLDMRPIVQFLPPKWASCVTGVDLKAYLCRHGTTVICGTTPVCAASAGLRSTEVELCRRDRLECD
jgi:hypothetical protein